MLTREINIKLIETIPENKQQEIFVYLTRNFCVGNSFKQKSTKQIYEDLVESRARYERGEYEDFDEALNEISTKFSI